MSRVYSFKYTQILNCSLEKAWDFFSNPANLPDITPANLNFKVISKYHGEKMYAGQLIEYKVTPVLGIPLYWMTEITHVFDHAYFVDEQRYGPYSLWHHQHHFKEVPGGVEMTDIVHYKLPAWFFGDLANWLFVRKQVSEIFKFREVVVKEKFDRD